MSRTAIQDANEGNTNIAKQQATLAKVNIASPGISKEKDIFASAMPVVEGATKALQTVNSAYQTQAAAGAAMRQGQKEGVNEVDSANKRGEFMSFLFGQDAGYSTAVGIATKNFANNEYLRQMDSVEKHLDKTPEEFQEIISKEVETRINENYANDSMARTIAHDQWSEQSRKLSREHTAKHMVYAQEQVFNAGVEDLTGQFDDIHMNMKPGSTQAAQEEAVAQLKTILDPSYKYVAEDGSMAHPRAARNIQIAAVTKQLAAGNSMVFKGIPDNFNEGLSVVQNNKLKTAFQQFDNAKARDGELIVEEGLLAAASGDVAGMTAALQRIDVQRGDISGSATSVEKWTEDKRRLLKAQESMIKGASKQSVADQRAFNYYKAREEGDAASAGEYHSKKAQARADDMVVMVAASNVARAMGIEDPQTEGEAIALALQSPIAIKSIATRAERFGSISGGFAEAVKQRVMNLIPDEKGYIAADDMTELDNLRELYRRAPGQMRKALGPDGSALVEITLNNTQESVKEIQDRRSNYVKNKGLTLTKQQLGLPSDMNVRDWIQQKTKTKLDPAAITHYEQQLQTGYQIFGGDTKAAENYMLEQYEFNNTHWRGKSIKNAGIVSEDVGIVEALDMLEGSGMAEALIGTRIPMMEDGNPIRGFGDLKDVQFEVNPGTGELYIQSSQFSFPIVIGDQELVHLGIKAQAGKDAEDARQEEAFRARMGVIGQTGQMWPTPQE